jgi:hypothetical protein
VAVTVALLATFSRRLQGQRRQHRPGHAAGPGGQTRSLEFLPGAQYPWRARRGGDPARCRRRRRPGAQQEGYRAAIASYEAVVADQAKKKEELRLQGGAGSADVDALNYRDDQFDLSDTLIALAISLLALTALTRKSWLCQQRWWPPSAAS